MAQPVKTSSGIYQLRRKVPKELVVVLGREYKKTLNTRDPSEAKERFAEEWGNSERAFALARAQVQGAEVLNARDIQQLAARWFRGEQARLEASGAFDTMLVPSQTVGWGVGEHSEAHLERVTIQTALDDGYLDEVDLDRIADSSVSEALKEHHIRGLGTPEVKERLRTAFREHWIRLSDFAERRYEGDWLAQTQVLEHEPLSIEQSRKPLEQKPRLLDLFTTYSEEKLLNDGDTPGVRKTLTTFKAASKQFIELCGDLTLEQIDRAKIKEYRALLVQLPVKGNGIRGLSALRQIELADSKDLPRISAATVRNKLRALSAVLSHGVLAGRITENPVIAGGTGRAAAKRAESRSSTSQVKHYSQEELRRIFSSPIFTSGWEPPRANFGGAWSWMPLLMYYTGARREELAQLAAKDVLMHGELPCLNILSSPEDDAGRSVKTAGSRRVIPIHPDLVKRGFLEYALSMSKNGQLFPLLERDAAGFYGANFGKRWAEYLRKVVALKSSASPSHGFRHTFKTLCREAEIAEDVHDAITGHAGGNSVARDYGTMPLERMAKELHKFPAIDDILERG
ncbi:site-specific integrase [Comamonas sp. Y33R10-2]|uniref:site-specific integrase n=1 Tax=Comamonas sp. Y33R10-2 TaxID=2853257 RepID=UPI001C5CB191|nr:site-specific integrase [Comamonas sp. Y33R10-2]QXZ08963.1 site-specific integrase [Comamonas sp. Y33R10-2]